MQTEEGTLRLTGLEPQTEDFKKEGERILTSFKSWVEGGASGAKGWALEPVNHEGYRVSVEEGEGKQGWLLLRGSLHDPLLVLNVESDVTGGEFGFLVATLTRKKDHPHCRS